MELNEYQERAGQTAQYPEIGGLRMTYPAMGLAGEAGELMNKVKKIWRDRDGELDEEVREELVDELGDVLWYVARLARELDADLETVGRRNVQKLSGRERRGMIRGEGDRR